MNHPARIAAAIAVVLAVGAAPAPARSQTQAAAPTATLLDRSPWVDVGGTLDVALDLTGPVPVDRIEVQVHGQLDSPAELDESRTGDVGPVLFTGTFSVDDLEDLGNDDRGLHLDVSDTVNEGTTVRLAFAGVYPLVITPIAADGTTGGPIRTPVIRRSGAGTTLDAPELFLALDMATTPSTPPTTENWSWAVGPDELDRLHRLVEVLEASGSTPVPVLVSGNAAAGLADLPDGAPPRITDAVTDVVALPTVPFDWTATSRAGLGELRPDLIAQGRSQVAATFPDPANETIWDGRGGLDVGDLDDIAAAGYDRVLVSSALVRLDTETPDTDRSDTETDGAVSMMVDVADAPDGLDILAVDESISDLLEGQVAGADAAHVAVADLVLRADDAAVPVAAVVDDAPAGSVLSAALPLLIRPDSPVPLRPLTAELDTDVETDADPASVKLLPPDGDMVDDIQALARRIRSAAEAVDTYADVVGPDDESALRARALVATSLQRGLTRPQREQMIAAVEELTEVAFEAVGFSGPTDHNLTSRTGSLPIGIVNNSAVPITVVLAASSDRLAFPASDTEECDTGFGSSNNQVCLVTTVPPGEVRIDLAVEALATGSVPMSVELRSPDGTTVFATRQLNVRSTAISGTGLVLSLGAIAVLLVWWVRTVLARRRDGPRATGTDVG